jgi:hypothetical protein
MRRGIVGRIGFHCQDILVHNDNLWVQSYTQRQSMLHFSASRRPGEGFNPCKPGLATTNYASGPRQTMFPVTGITSGLPLPDLPFRWRRPVPESPVASQSCNIL